MKGTERSVTYMLKSNLILKNLSVVKEINYDLELPLWWVIVKTSFCFALHKANDVISYFILH